MLVALAGGLVRAEDSGEPLQIVTAAPVERRAISREATFEAELRPYQEIELHARITGYLDRLKVDAGDTVSENQLIATLDVPELRSDLDHAEAAQRRSEADVVRAQASYDEAHLMLQRLSATEKAQPNLIAQQDIDAAKAKDRSAEASLSAAREQVKLAEADVRKLHITGEYAKITAPFAGVVTKRYSDPGALIQAGTSTGSLPLVRLSEMDRLRVVFTVSSAYVPRIRAGAAALVKVSALDREIHGKVARFNRRVDAATRTMEVEVDIPNEDLSLVPGLYASVVLSTESRDNALVVPVTALARAKGAEPSLYVINSDSRIEERVVKLGVETADQVEILGGVKQNEIVLTGSRAQVVPGQRVEARVVKMAPVAASMQSSLQTAAGH